MEMEKSWTNQINFWLNENPNTDDRSMDLHMDMDEQAPDLSMLATIEVCKRGLRARIDFVIGIGLARWSRSLRGRKYRLDLGAGDWT